jgi:predicted XRE-type DNA-binding protein
MIVNDTRYEDAEIIVGSGNVFADLGLPNPEERFLKAQLTAQIQSLLDERGLTNQQASEIFGMPTATVEGMLIGRLAEIPVTQLFACLNRLGRDVELRIFPTERPPEDARTTLIAA